VGEFVHTFGDLHLYENHVQQAGELLSRAPRELPKLHFEPKPIDAYTPDDFQLVGYNPHPPIPAPVAV
jgi:thymidylate synthase